MKPTCLYCGKEIRIFEEGECGSHPNEVWYIVSHACDDGLCIEMIQEGGSINTVLAALNKRIK
jgi:hypothetical protein